MARFPLNQRRFPQQHRPVFRPFDKVPSHVIAQPRFVSRPAPQSLVISRDVGCRIEVPFLQQRPSLSISAQRFAAMKSVCGEIVDAPHWGTPFDAVQFRGASLPVHYGLDVRPRAPLHFGGYIRRLHQPESHVPVSAAQNAGVQHPTHRVESIPPPRPRASGRARSMTERKSFRRLEWGVISIRSSPPRPTGT